MYHPDNLEEYYASKELPFDKTIYISDLTAAKNLVKDSIILQITLVRSGYPYFGEPDFNGTPLQRRFRNNQENIDQSATVQSYLNSDELETFYKSLPMKTYYTTLLQRQNISKTDLVKTAWLKNNIQAIVQ